MSQCLPSGLAQEDLRQLRQSFERLQSIGVDQLKWLGEKTQLSAAMQRRISDQASGRVTAAFGGNCANGSALVQEYRDKCAALVQNIDKARKEGFRVDPRTPAEAAQSAADFVLSTCYEPIDDVSRVSSYARMMHWKELSSDEKNMLKPADSTGFEGWQVDHDGDTYFISISHGHFKGRPTEVCQMGVPLRAELVVRGITEKIKARFVGSNNSGVSAGDVYELVKHPTVAPTTFSTPFASIKPATRPKL